MEPPVRGADAPSDHDVVTIFDTTLRDGEQAPGCSLSTEAKIAVARQLVLLGVDVIEAGFPAASPGDWDAVRAVAETVGVADGPVVCALARASQDDIAQCWSAVSAARRPRIHVFIATSDIHLEHKLRMTHAAVLARAEEMVTHARSLCADVQFSAEDAGRSDPAFLADVLSAAVAAGATTLNVPDTVGYNTPGEYGALFRYLRRAVQGVEKVRLSAHCHDDLGLAVANTLAAVSAGARQIECTINGLGERAGNAALEEIAMALQTRRDVFGVRTRIVSEQIGPASRLVSACTGTVIAPNKAIVGANAFAHEAGIHQHGVLRHRATYEILCAETVGAGTSTLVLGKHSGRHALAHRLSLLGYSFNDTALQRLFVRFKALADQKSPVDDDDLRTLAAGELTLASVGYSATHDVDPTTTAPV